MGEESTTPEVLDVWRRAIEAGSGQDLDTLMSIYAPDAVWEAVTGLGTHEGTAEIRRFFEDWLGAYEEFEVELEEILDLGNGVAFGVSSSAAARLAAPAALSYATQRCSSWWMA